MSSPRDLKRPRAGFWRRHSPTAAVLGVLFTLVGSLAMTFIIFVSYGDTAFCRRTAVHLGLALPLVISGVAQTMIILGIAWLWQAGEVRRT